MSGFIKAAAWRMAMRNRRPPEEIYLEAVADIPEMQKALAAKKEGKILVSEETLIKLVERIICIPVETVGETSYVPKPEPDTS